VILPFLNNNISINSINRWPWKKINVAECNKQWKSIATEGLLLLTIHFNSSIGIGIGNTSLLKYCYWYWQFHEYC